MDKIHIVGLNFEKDDILSSLMNAGALEVCDLSDTLTENDGNPPSDASHDIAQNANTDEIQSATKLRILMDEAVKISEKYRKEKKPMFSSKRKVSGEQFTETINNEKHYKELAEELTKLYSNISSLKRKVAKNEMICDMIKDWTDVDISLDSPDTKYTKIWMGTVPTIDELEYIHEKLVTDVPEFHTDIVFESDDCVGIILITWFERAGEMSEILKSYKFKPLQAQGFSDTPRGIYKNAKKDLEDAKSEIKSAEDKCFEIAQQSHSFEIIHDYAMMRTQKYISAEMLKDTDYTFILEGWAPSHLTSSLKKGLEKEFTVAFTSRKATSKDEYPILLKNSKLIKPYEVVTEMFSVPSTKDIDPNPLVSVFFLFFFSMMLSDAGYGLLLAGVCGIMLFKFKVEGNMRSICTFLFHGGLASVVWGILFGGFFGDIITVISTGTYSFPNIWFNPMDDPTKLMIWSMIFGVIHILAGLAAKSFILIITERKKDFVFDILPWFLIIIGAGGMLGGMFGEIATVESTGKYMVFAGLGIIVLFGGRGTKNPVARLFKGIAGLYDITGYFSDILSYTRIVALSLATAVIAMVVNILGGIAGFGAVGIILFLVVALIGHPLNLAISALGCYVHTSRLQYVEFFSKFYEGGGRLWNPLKVKTKYVRIS